jgi:hypothetical protein
VVAFSLDMCDTPKMKDIYKLALEEAMGELEKILAQRDKVDVQREELELSAADLRQAIYGLAALSGEDAKSFQESHPDLFPEFIDPDVGLTDAVREVMKNRRLYITPVGVRDKLIAVQYDLSKYKNVMASLHTVLKRLVDSKELLMDTRGGKTVYRWNPMKR